MIPLVIAALAVVWIMSRPTQQVVVQTLPDAEHTGGSGGSGGSSDHSSDTTAADVIETAGAVVGTAISVLTAVLAVPPSVAVGTTVAVAPAGATAATASSIATAAALSTAAIVGIVFIIVVIVFIVTSLTIDGIMRGNKNLQSLFDGACSSEQRLCASDWELFGNPGEYPGHPEYFNSGATEGWIQKAMRNLYPSVKMLVMDVAQSSYTVNTPGSPGHTVTWVKRDVSLSI